MITARVACWRAAQWSSALVGWRRSMWGVTALATVASTYALDTFSVAVGALLAASGLLAGLDRPPLLGFLAATYVLWATGLRANLAANWSLITTTGVSTNGLSKAAHDIARACHASGRTSRSAASAAYLLTEAAKEVPYYASAFGATLMSGAVTADDAIIFLAGTNVGAAVYEYGLAHATRGFMRHRASAEREHTPTPDTAA